MNYKKLYSTYFIVPLLVSLLTMLSVTGCSDDDDAVQSNYGYVQFKLYKSASFDNAPTTRATTDKLDVLKDAQKVKVVMQHDGTTISQTLVLNSYSADNAEFGLRSDKLQLLTGEYTIIGFYLYDKLDKELYAGPAGDDDTFTVIPDGLCTQALTVDAVARGLVSFKLIKELVDTRSAEGAAYPFSNIASIDITVKNLFTQELTSIKNVRVNYQEDFTDSSADEELYPNQHSETSYAECDTVVWLKAGSYQISSYTTYSDTKSKNSLETASVKSSKTFVVKDNEKTENAEVPIRLAKTAEYIKDYQALRAIWEKMDGKNWSYFGEAEVPGCNWNFNKDIDMWGDQPGVELMSDGRVATIYLSGFGAKGDVPDEIGQLTELRILTLGTHDEKIGGHLFANAGPNMTQEQKMAIRMDYYNKFLKKDGREGLSEVLKEAINSNPKMKPIISARISPKDVQFGNLTNQITGISKAMMRLTKLEQFYIANSPVTYEGFFKEVKEDSPFYDEKDEWSWENLSGLLDVEIYNCPRLTKLPTEMLANLPELQSLNIACNSAISAENLKEDWETLIEGKCGDKIQLLYMGYNNLEEFPEHELLKKMTKLGLLDCTHNKIRVLHPFGKEINITKIFLDNNQFTEVPGAPAADGYSYFSSYNDVETFSCSNNKLTKIPNIFNGKSIYVMGSLDLSHNLIDGFEDGEAHRGINAGSVDLSYNKLKEFPSHLFKSNSPVNTLMLAGNGMEKFKKGSITGPSTKYLQSLDLTYNNLSELPEDFNATNLPYLYGVDVSYNCFSKFPYGPLDAATLTIFAIRHQRDAKGNRTLREWPTGIYKCPSLVALYMGSNDLRKIDDTISPNIRIFEIKDNPNISINLSGVCAYINAGAYMLVYDKTQDIRGCDALDLDK